MWRDAQIAAVASRQRGLVTASQLRAAGVGRGSVAPRVVAGRLHPVHPGVYLVGHTVLPPLGRETAALLACAPRAALSHGSAAGVWGFAELPDVVHVTVVGRNPARPSGVVVHRPRRLDRGDIRRRHGLPLTSPERTLVDLAATEPPKVLERALTEAEVQRRLNRSHLLSLLDQGQGRRGVAKLKQLLDRPTFKTKREAERRLLDLLTKAGLRPDATNTHVAGLEVDVLYRDARLVVEMDSWTFHGHRAAFERDRERDAQLLQAGYRVLRVTWRQLACEAEAVVARVAGLLAMA